MVPMPTKAELKKWAPRASDSYIKAFLALESEFAAHGVLDDKLTLCHFLGQVGAETNGLTITRENMFYTSVKRIREVWPRRARKHSDLWIAKNLVRKPERLSAWAYGGRMGNKAWPSQDGFVYRGAGCLQTTGKYAFEQYCKKLGVELTPQIPDDYIVTTQFALLEWSETNCNKYALANDLLSVSKIINTGSAKSGIRPNGMIHRQRWLKRAWAVFGDDRRHIPEASVLTTSDLRDKGSQTISSGDLVVGGSAAGGVVSGLAGAGTETGVLPPPVPAPTPETVDTTAAVESIKQVNESLDVVTTLTSSVKGLTTLAYSNFWVIGIAFSLAGLVIGYRIWSRRTRDGRLNANIQHLDALPAIPDDADLDPEDAVLARV